MKVLIDRKFNEKQLLLETFFSKMHTEQDTRKKPIIFVFPTFSTIFKIFLKINSGFCYKQLVKIKAFCFTMLTQNFWILS